MKGIFILIFLILISSFSQGSLKETMKMLPKKKYMEIVAYYPLGIRSKDVAEQHKKTFYTNVYNLYSGKIL